MKVFSYSHRDGLRRSAQPSALDFVITQLTAAAKASLFRRNACPAPKLLLGKCLSLIISTSYMSLHENKHNYNKHR
ncbi:MAG: hypothetical protein K8R79_02495, partial [Calditrichales bacterium]|nr:hypothetical protein [Calditrichales bacterium]